MRLKRYKYSNIGSFGENNIVYFDKLSYPLAVFGINHASDGYESNGSGKTTFFNGIYWTLTGKMVKNLPISDLIRIGEDHCEGELVLERESSEITVQRSRTSSNESKLSVFVDGIDKSLRTNTLTQNYLYSLLGLNHKFLSPKLISVGLFNTIYLSLASVRYSFLSSQMEPKDKMEVLASYLGIIPLDMCTKKVKEDFSTLNKKFEEISTRSTVEMAKFDCKQLEDMQGVLKIFKESLDDLKKFVEGKESKLSEHRSIITAVGKYKDKMTVLKNQIDKLKSKREGLKESLGEDIECDVTEEDRERLKESNKKLSKSIEDKRNKVSTLNNTVSTLKRSLEKIIVCPGCHLELSPVFQSGILNDVVSFDSESCKFEIKVSEDSILAREEEIVRTKEKLDENRTRIIKLDSIKSRKNTHDTIAKLDNEITEADNKHKTLLGESINVIKKMFSDCDIVVPEDGSAVEVINGINSGITDLSTEVGDARSKLNSRLSEIESIEKSIDSVKSDYVLMKNINNEMKTIKFWIEGFPKIKKNIIESFIPSLEIQANAYLDRFCSALRISIQIDPFEISVFDSSGVKRHFDTFSGGESSRIALALSFAFSDLSGRWFGVETDFVLIDEIMDVMDGEGAKDLARILKEDGKQALVISHNSGVSGQFDHSITVVKDEQGISHIGN